MKLTAQHSRAHRRGRSRRWRTGARGLRLEQQEVEQLGGTGDNASGPTGSGRRSAPSSGPTASTRSTSARTPRGCSGWCRSTCCRASTELDDHNNFVASPLLTEMPSDRQRRRHGLGQDLHGHVPPEPRRQVGRRTARRSPRPTWCSAGTRRSTRPAVSRPPATTRSRASTRPTRRRRSCTSSETYNDWPDVMGGFSGVILEKAKFPGGRTSARTMTDLDPVLGWSLDPASRSRRTRKSWSPTRTTGTRTGSRRSSTVTFVPLTETTKEVQAIKTGQVSAIYPQPVDRQRPAAAEQRDVEVGVRCDHAVRGPLVQHQGGQAVRRQERARRVLVRARPQAAAERRHQAVRPHGPAAELRGVGPGRRPVV